MTRHTSTVLLAALGFTLVHGCTSGDDKESVMPPSSTTTGTTTSTDGSGATSSSNSSGNGTVNGASTTGNDSSSSGGGNGGTGGTSGQSLEDACPELAADCGASNQQYRTKEINMLIVLDKSGSMAFESGGRSKWDAMKDALSSALASDAAQHIEFGLLLYPFPKLANNPIDATTCGADGNCCEMPDGSDPQVGIGEGVDQVETVLDDTEPGGGTPTAVGLEKALQYFTDGPGAQRSGEKYVLLATDGGPNCNPGLTCGADVCTRNLDSEDSDPCSDAPDGNCCDTDYAGDGAGCLDDSNVVDEIEALRSEGIDTFVVGIPGSEAYSSYLDSFAEAGGRAVTDGAYSYYRVDDVNDLADTFNEITVQLVTSCELQFDDAPVEQPYVAVDCEIVPRFEDTSGQAGAGNDGETENWSWDGQTGTVTLQGSTCDMVSEGVQRVDVLFMCEGIN